MLHIDQEGWVLGNFFASRTMKRVGYKHFFHFGLSFQNDFVLVWGQQTNALKR